MDEALHARAAARLDEAVRTHGALDPRDSFRRALRFLREADPGAFEEAVRHYEDVLVPEIAAGAADPLAEWRAYGATLTRLAGPGRTLVVDASGRAREGIELASADPADLVLFLPRAPRAPALVLAGPAALSPAQRASMELLVEGRTARAD